VSLDPTVDEQSRSQNLSDILRQCLINLRRKNIVVLQSHTALLIQTKHRAYHKKESFFPLHARCCGQYHRD